MIVLHDDAKREYAYGPAQGLPATKVGTFTQGLYDEAKKQGWAVISMKNDWKRIFARAMVIDRMVRVMWRSGRSKARPFRKQEVYHITKHQVKGERP